jgi:uncharacterized membrane protein YbaN (DUF454 family)
MKQIVRISLGIIAIILGLVGLVVPILQGWLFLALGALLLSVDIPFFERIVTWIENRIPPVKKPVERFRNYLRNSKKPEKSEEEENNRHFPEN